VSVRSITRPSSGGTGSTSCARARPTPKASSKVNASAAPLANSAWARRGLDVRMAISRGSAAL
jgi:hypothetical protein